MDELQTRDLFVIDRDLMANIIATLKTLDVRGYESMDKLVGCVIHLERAMNNKIVPNDRKKEENTGEEKDPKPEEK